MLIDLGTAQSMLRVAENFVSNFNRSIFSKLKDDTANLNSLATGLYQSAGRCLLNVSKLSADVDALWNGSAVLNANLAGLLGVLNATYMQSNEYAALVRQFNASVVELQANLTATGARAEYINSGVFNLDDVLTNASTRLVQLNASLDLVGQTVADILTEADALLGYVEKIGDAVRQASGSSLGAFDAVSVLRVS